jgi:hypothetical protein
MTIVVPAARLMPVPAGNTPAPEPGTQPPLVIGASAPVPRSDPAKQVQPTPGSAASFACASASFAAGTANSSTWWTLAGVPG